VQKRVAEVKSKFWNKRVKGGSCVETREQLRQGSLEASEMVSDAFL